MEFFVDVHLVLIAIIYATRDVNMTTEFHSLYGVDICVLLWSGELVSSHDLVNTSSRVQ